MSKFFFKGRIELPSDYSTYNYNTDPSTKHGSKKHPVSLTVTSETREAEIMVVLKQHNLFANITLDADAEENIGELEMVLNKPKTLVLNKTPNRNDPCSCGSGKKFKKCCL